VAQPSRTALFRTTAVTVALAAAAIPTIMWAARLPRLTSTPLHMPLIVYIALCVAADNLAVKLGTKRSPLWFGMSEFATSIGLFLVAPGYMILGRTVGAASSIAISKKTKNFRRIVYNLVMAALTEAIAVQVAHHTGIGNPLRWTSWCSVIITCVAAGLFTAACLTIVILADGGNLNRRELGRMAFINVVVPATNACLAAATIILLVVSIQAAVLVGVVATVFALLLRQYIGLSKQMDELDTMYRFSQQLQGVSRDSKYVEILLRACHDTMVAQAAVLLVLDGQGGAQVTTLDGQGDAETISKPADQLRPLWHQVLASGQPVLARANDKACSTALQAHGWHDAIVAPLRTPSTGEIIGALAVKDSQATHGTFKPSQLRLFTALSLNVAISLENMRMVDRLRHNAAHDPLTGLPNRESFHTYVDRAISHQPQQPLAVLLVDLTRFKDVNDTLGHAAGDRILIGVAQRLAQTLGDNAYIARLGGDDFAVMLPHTDSLAQVAQVTEDIIACIEQPFVLDSTTVDVGATVGMATYPEHGLDSSALLKRADIAMGAAKGVSQYAMYSPERDQRSPRSLSLVSDLREAIQQHLIEVHFQPYADMRSEHIVGAEALVRWQHPQHGMIYPDEFIPLAERSGLIRPLTSLVLDTALAQQQAWRQDGHDLTMNVNLSVRDLLDGNLVNEVSQAMRTYQADPSKLVLEITESCLMTDREGTIQQLRALHNLGAQLAIDDFGTGYSSLSYLKDLPIDEIKVDKSFVMTMRISGINAAITQYIVELGKRLGLSVVAEGVEDNGAWHDLAGYGCDIAQGYLISRPVRPEVLFQMLSRSVGALLR